MVKGGEKSDGVMSDGDNMKGYTVVGQLVYRLSTRGSNY
jgi:hypothetical protein